MEQHGEGEKVSEGSGFQQGAPPQIRAVVLTPQMRMCSQTPGTRPLLRKTPQFLSLHSPSLPHFIISFILGPLHTFIFTSFQEGQIKIHTHKSSSLLQECVFRGWSDLAAGRKRFGLEDGGMMPINSPQARVPSALQVSLSRLSEMWLMRQQGFLFEDTVFAVLTPSHHSERLAF